MAAKLTSAATETKSSPGANDGAIPNVLGESHARTTTAVSKSPPKNLTRSAPRGHDQLSPSQCCGFRCCDVEAARSPDMRARQAGSPRVGKRDAKQSLQVEGDDDGNNGDGNDDDDDEDDSGDELADVGGGGRCKCVVCIGPDSRRDLVGVAGGDGNEDGSSMVATATAEDGEVTQCALHGVFSPPATCAEAWTWTTRKAKSSCFTILCKTCANRIFQHSPSPPASSSLCVHGRRRGRRNSTPPSSIRKENVALRSTQFSVANNPCALGRDPDEKIVSENPVRFGDLRRVDQSAESVSKSVRELDAWTALLTDKSGIFPFAREKNSDAKAIIQAINRILEARKPFVSCDQAACEKRKQLGTAQNVSSEGTKPVVKGPNVCVKNATQLEVNQSSRAEHSQVNENFSLINEIAFPSKDLCVENILDACIRRKIESQESSDSSSRGSDKLSQQFNGNKVGNNLISQPEDLAIRLSDGGCRPQPTSIQKDCSEERKVADAAGIEQSNCEPSFVASNRLKRLEEHFKGFAFTKKLPKDEPLVDVTDSDCSINSLCHDVPHEFLIQKQLVEALHVPPASFSSRTESYQNDCRLFGSESPVHLEVQKDCSPLADGSSSSVNLSKLSICQDTSSARPDNEVVHDKCRSASKHDSFCLPVPGKRQTSASIHSSLSTTTANPSQSVAPKDFSSQIDQQRPDTFRSDSIVSKRLQLNVDVDPLDDGNEPGKDTLEQQCKQPELQEHSENHQHLKYTSTNPAPKRKYEQTVETVEQQRLLPKKTKNSQDSQQTLLQHVTRTAECQLCVEGSDENSQAKDEGECAESSAQSSGKPQRYTREVPPPPLPPRLSPASGRSVLANKIPFAAKHYCENNNVYDCPLSVISSRKHAVGADSNGKNSFINNNNISHSECASRHHASSSSFHSLPAILHGSPPPDGGVASCCEFDVRFIDDFGNFSLTLECYDEFEVENCCENNYCHSGHESSSSSPPSGSSCAACGPATSQCSVIEAVPLFQYHRHQSHPREADHQNLQHHIHHCHVPPNSTSTMRELNGPLRGLLKKPNRPPPTRKNRVVFDETRNEFFEADYIILIREDCAYDEEDEEPCTCGEHELVRLCCEEGCQCNYSEDNVTPQAHPNLQAHPTQKSPKYAPPIEFVDEAALSPPDGYKDNGLNALSGALSGHVFGAQHIQQLQVIQRLQQQRAAMLAARASNQQSQSNQQQPQPQQQQQKQQQQPAASSPIDENSMAVCTECVECVECAAKQLQDEECVAVQCQEDIAQLSVPHVALVPLHNNSPERRITQKEIIAGEERPKYVAAVQLKEGEDEGKDKKHSVHKNQRYVVETITMTTVTERRIVHESTQDVTTIKAVGTPPVAVASTEATSINRKPPIPAKPENIPAQISGILKGGKLWKNEMQAEESSHPTSDDDSNSKRSVRFTAESLKEISKVSGEGQTAEKPEEPINELIPLKKHSTLFHNVLRPNSAVRQLFPAGIHPSAPATALTHEALKAFEESKRGGLVSNMLTVGGSDTDTIRRTIERNALRRSLIKKKAMKADMTLEERIKQLTCDIDEPTDSAADDESAINVGPYSGEGMDRRDSPAGEENPSQGKYIPDKSFSPSSSASSSSSGSTSAYRKISDIFNRDRRQEKIPEAEENPIVIIPQECRCPAAPDLGMGVQVPAAHTQIHQTPPRQTEPRRQFLSTLAPLTACVAGQKDDFSYYTLAAGDRSSTASAQCSDYSLGDIESALSKDESRKVAPDVIAGTPGQEQDELVIFAQQEATRTDKIKKRYSNEHQIQALTSNASSDDDEQNDYGFNKRPTVQGIKAKFETTNKIIEEMQAQLSQALPSQQSNNNTNTYNTLKGKNSVDPNSNKTQQQVQPNSTMPQNPADRPAWGYYSEDQRNDLVSQQPNYYQALPANFKQSFHTHEESLMYQNCQSVSMRQHYGRFARSPSRRPESPPPLRNYHQTMVLIPYNTQSYAQFSTTDDQQAGAHQFRRQNVLEYQQVTQQTIRVPIGYTIPGMQLHLVAGRGAQQQQQQQHVQYSQNPRLVAPRTFNMAPGHDPSSMKFAERGVPEGSASTSHTDCKGVMSPTSSQAGQNQCNQTAQVSPAVPGAVFYAMNV